MLPKSVIRVSFFIASLIFFDACGEPTSSNSRLELPLVDRIVFVSDRDNGKSGIYAMRIDGTDVRQLSEPGTDNTCPSVSPDGNWIAYYNEEFTQTIAFSLVLMRADGTDKRTLAEAEPPFAPRECPIWTADSKRVLFPKLRDHSPQQLSLFRTSGVLVAAITAGTMSGVTMSPAGQHVVYTVWQGSIGPNINHELEIHPMDGFATRLASGAAPSWSPTAAEIAYVCRDTRMFVFTPTGICIAGLSGNSRQIVTDSRVSFPFFSPDGKFIAYNCGSAPPSPPNRFCVVRPNGDAVSMSPDLQRPESSGRNFAWSPDSRSIAFECTASGRDICVMDADGSNIRNLTNNPASDGLPSWSPLSARQSAVTSAMQ